MKTGGLMRNIILLFFLLIATTQLKAEDRIKIAVIDSGISFSQATADYACKDGHKSFVDGSIYAQNNHGQNIISIISKAVNPKTHCIRSYKVYYDKISGEDSLAGTVKSLKHIAKDYSVRFLNISMGGAEPDYTEKLLIKRLLIRGVQIAVAAGNKKTNLDRKCNYYPACYKQELDYYNFYVVKSKLDSSNYGKIVTDTYRGYKIGTPVLSGTSQATAQKMVFLLKSMVYSNRRLDDRLRKTKTNIRDSRNYR